MHMARGKTTIKIVCSHNRLSKVLNSELKM